MLGVRAAQWEARRGSASAGLLARAAVCVGGWRALCLCASVDSPVSSERSVSNQVVESSLLNVIHALRQNLLLTDTIFLDMGAQLTWGHWILCAVFASLGSGERSLSTDL